MFQLVFKGECVPGTDLETARNNARTLFKASLEQVDRMFSGQPVVIRNKLEEVQAEKYRAVLKKHGMVAYVQPMTDARPAAGGASEARPSAPENQPPKQPEPAAPPAEAKRGGVPETEPGDRLPVAGEKVDTILSGSGLSLDPVGVTLAEKTEVEPPMFQHLDEWSLAPPGSDLGVERDLPPPVIPDASHLSLAEDDSSERK